MARIFFLLFSIFLIAGCSKPTENTMTVTGVVEGLKKGTLYFQKIQDSTLVNIDSLEIKGDGNFVFEHELESPEIFYLYLDKADNNTINDRLTFFGEPTTIYINTSWNKFDSNAVIKGSKSHSAFEECKAMLSRFGTRELELVGKRLNSEVALDSITIDSLENLSKNNLLRRYQYVLNFALTNPDSYVSPYLALTEVSDANPVYLDSINKSLSERVAKSKYGRALNEYVKNLREKAD